MRPQQEYKYRVREEYGKYYVEVFAAVDIGVRMQNLKEDWWQSTLHGLPLSYDSKLEDRAIYDTLEEAKRAVEVWRVPVKYHYIDEED